MNTQDQNTTPLIALSKVSFQYKDSTQGLSLKDIDLTISQGEVVLLCGQSGCGKTTITRLVNGLIPQFFEGDLWGNIHVKGHDVSVEPVNDNARFIGSVFQNPKNQFFTVDTDGELAFGCENLGWSPEAIQYTVEEITQEFGIERLRGCNLFRLSGGENQMIACASVSAVDPDVLVLDEPASNLDVESIAMLAKIIAHWKESGKTIIIAEHRLAYLMDVVDRIVFMENGMIVWDKSPNEVRAMSDSETQKLGLRRTRQDWFYEPERHTGNSSLEYLVMSSLSFEHGSNTFGRTKISSEDTSPRKIRGIHIDELSVPRSSIVGIIGPNGAGKTTFARCLCGLDKKAQGTISLENTHYKTKARRKLCYLVMQDVNHQLFTESVAEELRISLDDSNIEEKAREHEIDVILQKLDLFHLKELHPLSLSGGQKQRVAIAGALASKRKVMVFDEPTSGLDWRHMQDTAKSLRELSGEGITSFVITHDPELIAECCDWIIYIDEGSILWSRPLDKTCKELLAEFFVHN